MKKKKSFWQVIKEYWQINILQKEFVINLSNNKVHYCTCEWVDNMKVIKRITKNSAEWLIRMESSDY